MERERKRYVSGKTRCGDDWKQAGEQAHGRHTLRPVEIKHVLIVPDAVESKPESPFDSSHCRACRRESADAVAELIGIGAVKGLFVPERFFT